MDKLEDSKDLKNVGMASVNDFPIEADYGFTKFCGITKILSFSIAAILVILCFIFAKPTILIHRSDEIPLIDDKYQVDFTIDDISSVNRLLHISAFLENLKEANITFRSEMALTATSDEQLVFTLSDINNNSVLQNSNIQKNSLDLYHIFTDYNLNYDTLSLSLAFETKMEMPKNVSLLIEKGNSLYSLEIISLRCLLALIFAIPIAFSIRDFAKGEMMFEQQLTLAVLCFSMVYADPLAAINLYYPMSFNHMRELIVKDLYICFFIFYILTLYTIIGLEPGVEKMSKLGIPYMFCLIFLVAVMAIDSTFGGSRIFGNTLDPVYDYKLMTFTSFIAFSLFFLYYLFISIKTIIKKQNLEKQRALNYTISSLPFIVGMEVYYGISAFTDIVRNSAFEEVFPLAMFSGCVLVLKCIHRTVKKSERGLYTTPDSKENQDNQFGIETENIPSLPPLSDDSNDQEDPMPSTKTE